MLRRKMKRAIEEFKLEIKLTLIDIQK